jgi:hypothetical protein
MRQRQGPRILHGAMFAELLVILSDAAAVSTARDYRFAFATASAMKRGSAKAPTWTSGVQYWVLKLPAFL